MRELVCINDESRQAILLRPWEREPYRLFSWWDMERFSAAQFFALGKLLERVKADFKPEASSDPKISHPEAFEDFMEAMREPCTKIGLRLSLRQVEELHSKARELTNQQAANQIETLEKLIRLEMRDQLFMFVPSDRAGFYNRNDLFGADVNAAFPQLQFDIVEAGNCYAVGRGTACVFHLMRVMEIGVQEFGNKLGVALAKDKNWQNILNEANRVIKALPPKDPKTVELSQTAANLYSVKLGWRNQVMHPKDTYTLEEAESLIDAVKSFMVQLSKI